MARGVIGRTTGVFAPRLKGDGQDGKQGNFQDRTGPSLPSLVTGGQPMRVVPASAQVDISGGYLTNPSTQPTQQSSGTPTAAQLAAIAALPAGWKPTYWANNPNAPVGNPNARQEALDAKAEVIVKAWLAANQPPQPKVVSNPYTNAIKLLQQQIAGGQYGTSYDDSIKIIQDQIDSGQYGTPYDRLSTQLGQTGLAAGQQIDAASLAAITGLSSRDPLAQSTYAPSTAQIPQAALSDYLTSIGAGTNEVDANRNFLQSMIDSENAQAQQYTSQINQAQDAQREAAIQAVYGNQAYSQSQLGTAQSAQEFAINAAREAELKKLQDQILGYTTDAATSKSEGLKNLQDQILQYTLKGGKTSGKTSGKKSNKKGGKK